MSVFPLFLAQNPGGFSLLFSVLAIAFLMPLIRAKELGRDLTFEDLLATDIDKRLFDEP